MATRKAQSKKETATIESTPSILQVTNVQVYILKEAVGRTKAMVRCVLNDQLQMTGMRLVEGSNGMFLAFPNDPSYKGEDYRSLYYPVTRELRDHMEQAALKKYEEELKA